MSRGAAETARSSGAAGAFDNSTRRQISRQIVALLKDYVGRGPQNAHTYIFERLIVVLLEDTLTRAEQSLVESDGTRLVRDIRRGFAAAMADPLAALIEDQTGHKIHAVMGDHSISPDYGISAFLLEEEQSTRDGTESISIERAGDDAGAAAQRRKISDGVVALFKEYIGRGPRQVWTYRDGAVVVVLLSDAMTKAEHTLVADGRADSVREIRRQFQAAMRPRMIELIETQAGREVHALLSDHSVRTDHGIEVFVLKP